MTAQLAGGLITNIISLGLQAGFDLDPEITYLIYLYYGNETIHSKIFIYKIIDFPDQFQYRNILSNI